MTQPPTDQQLAEIEARLTAEHLTPGPWHTEKDGTDDDVTVVYVNRTSPKGVAYSSVLWQADWATDADADFTAHAREDVEALLAEVHRLRDALATTGGERDCLAMAVLFARQWTPEAPMSLRDGLDEILATMPSPTPATENGDEA